MHDANRDLLVLPGSVQMSEADMDRQVLWIDQMLRNLETWEVFCKANELIDINRRKIIRKPHHMRAILSERTLKAFVFTSNKN